MTGKNTSGDRRKCDDNKLSDKAETGKLQIGGTSDINITQEEVRTSI